MTIRLLGINHRTAPIEMRERLAIAPESLGEAALALVGTPGVSEGMILSTCNRVELLTSYEQAAPDVMDFLHRYFALEADVLRPHLYEYEGADAVRHLFRVASSLDSMVLGEPQILGQVKEAYSAARAAGAVQSFAGTVAADDLHGSEARAHGDADRQRLGIHCVGRGGSGEEDLRLARGQDGAAGGRGQDERAGGAAPDPAGRALDADCEPDLRARGPAGADLRWTRGAL